MTLPFPEKKRIRSCNKAFKQEHTHTKTINKYTRKKGWQENIGNPVFQLYLMTGIIPLEIY
jgi:hypothetical protein